MQPTLSNKTPKGEHEEDARPARAVEHHCIRRIFHGGKRLIDHQPGDGARRVMDARLACGARVGAMAEALVHLAQHAHRNVREVEVAPIDLGLCGRLPRRPAPENRVEVGEYLLADEMLGTMVKAEVCCLAVSAVVMRDRFIDQRKEVAVEGRIKPRRGLRGLLGRGKTVLESGRCAGKCRPGRTTRFRRTMSRSIKKRKKSARPAIERTSIASSRPFPVQRHEFIRRLREQVEDLLINVVRAVQLAVLLKRAMHETLKEEGAVVAAFFDNLYRLRIGRLVKSDRENLQ